MEIRLKRENNEILYELALVYLEIYRKQNTLKFVLSLSMGIILLAAGILTINFFGSFWNFFSATGISFLYVLYIYAYQARKTKRKALLQTRDRISKLKQQRNITEFVFMDSMATYKDCNINYQANWSYFSHHFVYMDCLFIVTDKASLSGFAIAKRELPPEEFRDLLNFLAKKLPALKI